MHFIIRKLKHREVKLTAQDHSASKWLKSDLNSQSWLYAFDNNAVIYPQGEQSFGGGTGTQNSRAPKKPSLDTFISH